MSTRAAERAEAREMIAMAIAEGWWYTVPRRTRWSVRWVSWFGADRWMGFKIWFCWAMFSGLFRNLTDPAELTYLGAVYSRISPWVLLKSVPIIFLVVTTVVTLMRWKPMRWSWVRFFRREGEEEQPTNINIAPVYVPYVGFAFFVMIAAYLPRFAQIEEHWFRDGTAGWGNALWRSLLFGLAHCLAGVPLGVGLALTIPGLWFTAQYFEGGIGRATIYHTGYNALIMVLLGLAVWKARRAGNTSP